MTPRIITYFLCGMRHPTTGLSEGDLSRLTGSSSSTASSCSNSSSSSSSSSSSPTPSHSEKHQTSTSVAIVATDVNGTKTIATTARDKDIQSNATTTTKALLDAEHLKNLKNSSTTSTTTTTTAAATKNHTHLTSKNNNNINNNNNNFNSSYLPEFIDPLDWQKSRKRKERLDSNSSTTQDRKLIRSNSEELLPPCGGEQEQQQQQQGVTKNNAPECLSPKQAKQQIDVIRRVASEDFKRTPYCSLDLRSESADAAVLDPKAKQSASELAFNANGNENDASIINRQQHFAFEPLPPAYSETLMSGPTKDMTRRSRLETTSPARSNRHSPNRNGGGGSKYHRDSDDSECENERRRSSERFCKSRAPPGRKAPGVMKKSGKYLPTKMRGDENTYKYDLSALKYERRGFVSKKLTGNAAAANAGAADHNDNNLIDFHIMRNSSSSSSSGTTDTTSVATSKKVVTPVTDVQQTNQRGSSGANNATSQQITTTSAEASLPWDRSAGAADIEPVLSRRYAAVRHRPLDCIDTAAKLSKVMPYPQQFHKQAPAQLMADDCIEPMLTFRAFTSLENIKTHDVLHQVIPAMMSFQTPEERLKQVSKRLTALKKKLGQFEEAFETRMGYRPSQAEKLNDRYMKNVLAEMSKLRKEKHELKSNPMGVMGLKVSGGMDGTKKLEKMKSSLEEIEQNLSDKREDANRSEALEELSADQLLQEKTAVQHGLLYLESLYGRPATKDERDAARPLYDRYRQLKRMVSRSVTLSGCAGVGAPELPTILEHEAMVFEYIPQQYSSNNSTDTTNSPSESVANTTTTTTTIASQASSEDDSTTTTTTTTGNMEATASSGAISNATQQSQTLFSENISALNIDQLWEQLDKTREEKKLLKRTIREFETIFEEQNGRKMLKSDRKTIEETYAQYKEKKAKTRLLQALIKKQISH